MQAKRLANAVGGIVCLALGGYACVAAIALLVGITNRSAGAWLVGALVFTLGAALILFGITFGARAISGDMPTRKLRVSGRLMARAGYGMLAFPVWFHWWKRAAHGGHRQPTFPLMC